jgi:hypothetical protein
MDYNVGVEISIANDSKRSPTEEERERKILPGI